MQKPFNAEGLDLTFLFDSTYPDPSITEANDMAAAPTAMPGFTPEQASSLQRLLSASINEALQPLLRPLGEFLRAWEKGPQPLSFNTSSTYSTSPGLDVETHSLTPSASHHQLSSTGFVQPSAVESQASLNERDIKNAFQPKREHSSNGINVNLEVGPPSSFDRVPTKRKATALDEAMNTAAKKNCTFGLVGNETFANPDVERCSTEVQVKEEPTPETALQSLRPSSTEEHASMFLSPAPTQSDTQPASSQDQAMEESSADTESIQWQSHPASTDATAAALRPLDTSQTEGWLEFAEDSAGLKTLFKDEPRMDKPCPTKDYFAEKPASLAQPWYVYQRSFPRLPFNAPFGCAHVIDVTKTYHNKSAPSIRMADIVVTFLYNYCPDLLHAFLNFTRHPEFSFARIEAFGGERHHFSIERSGLTVTVSYFLSRQD